MKNKIETIPISTIILKQSDLNLQPVIVRGWIKFIRSSSKICFIDITDGSNLKGIQVIAKSENDLDNFTKLKSAKRNAIIEIQGILIKGKNDSSTPEIELKEIIYLEKINNDEDDSIGKKEHSLEFLREISHTRGKTSTFYSIFKIRSVAALAIHDFFKKENYVYINTPIITENDAEGAGETFSILNAKNKNFWNQKSFLTVSGQLHVEAYSQVFGSVYTFGPTFRAENSNTQRHAVEFWMLEPEIAFANYDRAMIIGEELIKYVIKKVLNACKDELEYLQALKENNNTDHIANLSKITDNSFEKISYENVIKLLIKKTKLEKKYFDNNDIKLGMDLASEHEKYIASEVFKKPVYIHDYPIESSPFYMASNKDGTTSKSFDLIVPNIGELIGGSERENNYSKLENNLMQKKLPQEKFQWYLDLRKKGYAQSSGFGLGFERLVMLLTGMKNIRDTITFPRTPGNLKY